MIYGLIGEKLSHSYSPQIHRTFFDITGMKGDYRLFELRNDELEAFLKRAVRQGYRGLNVTIPYKTEVIPFLKQISTEASHIGAVNTITLNGSLVGYNTDYFGIDYTFKKNNVELQGKRALVLGSGGAAKSVVAYLLDSGIESIFLASRNPNRVSEDFPLVNIVSYEHISKFIPFDIIVNTTPVGMVPKTGLSPLKPDQLKGTGFLFDLIYNPAKTEMMNICDSFGIHSVNGLYMLIAQAVKAQEIWNDESYGLDMVDAIYKHINACFEN
jgi:shikimate dehydrogenase